MHAVLNAVHGVNTFPKTYTLARQCPKQNKKQKAKYIVVDLPIVRDMRYTGI